MHHAAHFAKRAVHLNAKHQHDQQNRQAGLAVDHPIRPKGQRAGGAQRDTDIGNAAGERIGGQHPHR